MRAVLVLDTNFFLHGMSLHTVRWLEAAKELQPSVTEVVLAIPPVVLDELERHKVEHDVAALRHRADDAMVRLWNIFGGGPAGDVPLLRQPGVAIRLLRDRVLDTSIDVRFSDEQLLAALSWLKNTEATALVGLVSRDVALKLRAVQKGHQVTSLSPSDWRPSGPATRRSRMEVSVQLDDVELVPEANVRVPKVVRTEMVAATLRERLAEHKMQIYPRLLEKYPAYNRRGAELILDAMADQECVLAEGNARDLAHVQQMDSVRLRLTLAVKNTGSERLSNVVVDPLEAQVDFRPVRWSAGAVYVGKKQVEPDDVGINPTQTALFHFVGILPQGDRQRGVMAVRVSYGIVTASLAAGIVVGEEPVLAELEVDLQPAEIHFGDPNVVVREL